MGRANAMKFMALLTWDEESSSYHGWFPGLPGARARASTRDSLEDALDEALRFSLKRNGDDTGQGRIDFWMLEISARQVEKYPGLAPGDSNAA